MQATEKRTSEVWHNMTKDTQALIIDPDGWHRDERFKFEWFEELITWQEFEKRRMFSTCVFRKGYLNI